MIEQSKLPDKIYGDLQNRGKGLAISQRRSNTDFFCSQLLRNYF